MRPLTYTLVADGPRDRCLLPIIDWVIKGDPGAAERGFIPQFADPRHSDEARSDLGARVAEAVQRFPCDLVLVHRDAEREPLDRRREEIRGAVDALELPPHVAVVPVRMTEAWLLIDERAIRAAAGNPNGKSPLDLPPLQQLEGEPDPKAVLHRALVAAQDLGPRRRAQFQRRIATAVLRVAELIEDFQPLRGLHAFQVFEGSLHEALTRFRHPE